jgi:hypothetical protein
VRSQLLHSTAVLLNIMRAGIDWINDIIINRFDHATESLVEIAATEKGLAEKKVLSTPIDDTHS